MRTAGSPETAAQFKPNTATWSRPDVKTCSAKHFFTSLLLLQEVFNKDGTLSNVVGGAGQYGKNESYGPNESSRQASRLLSVWSQTRHCSYSLYAFFNCLSRARVLVASDNNGEVVLDNNDDGIAKVSWGGSRSHSPRQDLTAFGHTKSSRWKHLRHPHFCCWVVCRNHDFCAF